MSYMVKVFLDKVVCREAESSTTSDKFLLVTTVATDSQRYTVPHEIKRLNSGDTATYAKEIFNGPAEQPALGLVLLGFDIDQSWWRDNEAEIRRITGAKENQGFLDLAQQNPIGFLRTWTVEAIDIIDNMDFNDRVLDWSELIPISDAPYGAPISFPLQARTANPDDAGADYSVHLVITIERVLSGISDAPRSAKSWVECKVPNTQSRPDDWIGRWASTDGDSNSVAVSVSISANKLFTSMLDVSVTEVDPKTKQQTVIMSERVPISRVFAEVGFRGINQRALESEKPPAVFRQTMEGYSDDRSGLHLTTERDVPVAAQPDSVTRFSMETHVSSKAISKYKLSGPDFGPEKLAVREQIGPDFLWLKNQALLEIYRIIENGRFSRFGFIYLRPVTNPLYREGRTFQVARTLEHLIV
jgi:hypothetical protein